MKNSDHFKWLDQIPIKGTPGATSAFGWSNNAIFQYRMFWANTQHKCTQSGSNKFVGALTIYMDYWQQLQTGSYSMQEREVDVPNIFDVKPRSIDQKYGKFKYTLGCFY